MLRGARPAFAPCSLCNHRVEQSPSSLEGNQPWGNGLLFFARIVTKADLPARTWRHWRIRRQNGRGFFARESHFAHDRFRLTHFLAGMGFV